MKTKKQQFEIWTCAVDQLPKRRRDLPRELFATITTSLTSANWLSIEAYGLLGHLGWIQIAAQFHQAVADRREGVQVRISSRAQDARGARVVFIAMEKASEKIKTMVVAESAGLLGAAFALGGCAQTLVCEDASRIVGGLNAKVAYGKHSDHLAHDIELILRTLAGRRAADSDAGYAQIVGSMVNSQQITHSRAGNALALLNDTEGMQ